MIRLATSADASAVARIYAPFVAGAATSFELTPPTADEMDRRIAATQTHAPWLVCCDGAAVLGFAYAARHRDRHAYQWSLDATVYVDPRAHRRGVGRALYTALLTLARAQGFYAVHAGITLPNPASVGLHESFGFRPIGVYPGVGHKLGAWHDVGWWQLELRDRTTGDPAPTRRPEELSEAEWGAAFAAGDAVLRRAPPT